MKDFRDFSRRAVFVRISPLPWFFGSRGIAGALFLGATILFSGVSSMQQAYAATADDTQSATPDTKPTDTKKNKKANDDQLEEVVVTGSLIPRIKQETSTPLLVITA